MSPIRSVQMLTLTLVSLLLLPQDQVHSGIFIANSNVTGLGRPPSRVPGTIRSGNEQAEYLDEEDTSNPCLSSLVALEPGEEAVVASTTEGTISCPSSIVNIATTQTPQPVIWVYFPNYKIPELPLKITLKDNQQDINESWQINLSEPSGVQCFELPYFLNSERIYAWKIEALFTRSPIENPIVGGLINYDPSALNTWKDQLTTVGQQLITAPTTENHTQWQTLLQAEGLDIIADAIPNNACLTLTSTSEPVTN